MNKKIIYTGAFRFPDKDAAAARVLSIGKVFKKLGYVVIFAGWEEKERDIDLIEDGCYRYQGFEYHSMNELKEIQQRTFFQKAIDYGRKGTKTADWIKAKEDDELFAVVVYNSSSYLLSNLYQHFKGTKVKVIADVTEWYDGSHLPMGRFGLPSLDNEWRMKVVNSRVNNLIVISSFLEKYYNNKGCHAVRIPPLVDIEEDKWKIRPSKKTKLLTLVYAGSPGKKDYLGNIIRALSILNHQGKKVELHIYGLNREQTNKYAPVAFEEVSDQIMCYGRIPQVEVPQELAKADYSVLLRPDKRYAHAGFSTKVVESMTVGLPVISNETGDLKDIIGDNINGYIIDSPSAKSLSNGLIRLLAETEIEHATRKKNALNFARSEFHYENYVKRLENYISKIKG